jgi:hypothetical protein
MASTAEWTHLPHGFRLNPVRAGTLSIAAHAKIAAAQKARWAKTKRAAKKEARDAVSATKTVNPKRPGKRKTVKKAVAAKSLFAQSQSAPLLQSPSPHRTLLTSSLRPPLHSL